MAAHDRFPDGVSRLQGHSQNGAGQGVKQPLVSVILPTLNRSEQLRRAVASVLGQTFSNIELIVVDDGSRENIRAVVSEFGDSRARVIRHQATLGVSAARNTGIEAAAGEFIAFQDSDDEWRCEKLAVQVAQLKANEGVGLSLCGLLRVKCDGSLWQYPDPALARAYQRNFQRAARMNPFAFTQTWLVSRECLKQVGRFDEMLRVWEDWDMLLRISMRTGIVLEPEPLVILHATPGSLSGDYAQREAAMRYLLDRWGNTSDNEFLARLNYLWVRYKLLNHESSGLWPGLLTALRLNSRAGKAWLLAGMLLLGSRLPARYFQSRQFDA